jgi:hypothetical protein
VVEVLYVCFHYLLIIEFSQSVGLNTGSQKCLEAQDIMLLYVPRNFRNTFIVEAVLLSSVFPLGWVEKLKFMEDIF